MYLCFDLETNTKELYGRKANPWYNDIVAIGYKFENKNNAQAELGPFDHNSGLADLLDKVKLLIGHNIKFDLLYLWKDKGFQEWLLNGGEIWDTQLVEYYLTNLQSKMSALRDIAVNKYNCKSREKHMEEYWENGVDTKDIPPELVLKDVINDVLDTENIYKSQMKKVHELKMLPLIKGHMDGLLATCEMEYNGMFVNKEILNKNKGDLQKQYQESLIELQSLVKPYWS